MLDVMVLMTCRNYERYGDHALDSVFRQTVPVGRQRFHDCCGEVNTPIGAARARNLLAAGCMYDAPKYIIFLDADDYLPTNYVEELLKVANGDECVVACPARLFGDEQRKVDVRDPVNLDTLLKGNTIHVSALVPFKLFCEAGGFDPTLESHEDWDLWCRLAVRGAEFRVCRSTHLWYRRHAGSRSVVNRGGYQKVFARLNAEYAKEKV